MGFLGMTLARRGALTSRRRPASTPSSFTFAPASIFAGGDMNTVEFAADGTVYGGTDVGGMRRLAAGSTKWTTKRRGAAWEDEGRKVAAVHVRPFDGAIFSAHGYQGTGNRIYMSTDGGNTWVQKANNATSPNFGAQNDNYATGNVNNRPRGHGDLTSDPTNGYLYAIEYDGSLKRSTNDGESWTVVAGTTWKGRAICLDPADPTVAYVATYGNGLQRVTGIRGTGTATRVNTGAAWDNVEDVVPAPTGSPRKVYAACRGGGVGAYSVSGGSPGYLTFDGSDVVSTPDHASFTWGNAWSFDFDITMPDWTPTVAMDIVGQWSTAVAGGPDQGIRIRLLTTGVIEVRWARDTTGTAIISSNALGFTDGSRHRIRVSSTTGGVIAIEEWTGSAWTSLGGGTDPTGVKAGQTNAVTIGRTSDAGTGALVGSVHAVTIAVNGTTVASPDFTMLTGGATLVTDAQDKVWTFSGPTVTAGSGGAGGWTDLTGDLPSGPLWTTLVVRRSGGVDQALVGCVDPAISSGTNYGSVMRSLDLTGTPTWATASVPANVSEVIAGTSTNLWVTAAYGAWKLGKDMGHVFRLRADPTNPDRVIGTAYAVVWETLAAWAATVSWRPLVDGHVISSMADCELVASGATVGNTDHDAFASTDLVDWSTWSRVNVGGSTVGFSVTHHGGNWFLGVGERDANTDGDLMTSTNPATGYTTTGLAAFLSPGAEAAAQRPLGICAGQKTNASTISRVVAYVSGVGVVYKNMDGAWTAGTGVPATGQTNWAIHTDIIWPDPVLAFLYLYDRKNGVYRSTDRGATWTRVWNHPSDVIRTGYVAAAPGSSVLYVSADDGLFRISNATSGTVTAATSVVTTIDNAVGRAGPIVVDPATGKLYYCRAATSTQPAQILRFDTPATATSVTDATDLADDAYRNLEPLPTGIDATDTKILLTTQGTAVWVGSAD